MELQPGTPELVKQTDKNAWVNSIVEFQLRSMIQRGLASGDRGGLVREAFIHLEQRIRESAGLPPHLFGQGLIEAAFHPQNGRLQPVSPVEAERAGLHKLLLGIFLYYRNPIAHRPVYHSDQASRQILQLIDHALELVRQSAEQVIDLSVFVSPHEGQILGRRDYRIDIDDDGEEDIVALVAFGPTMDAGELKPHLAPIILKKGEKSYTRIPSDWVTGGSLYGPVMVEARHITNRERPDIVIGWAWGETQTLYVVLRYDSGRYSFVGRDNPPDLQEPYSGPGNRAFTGHHYRKQLSMADIDGDGLVEIIQTLRFDGEDLMKMSYPEKSAEKETQLAVCRVWKWDSQKQLLALTEERLIMERWDRLS